jgi:hypothetical protein
MERQLLFLLNWDLNITESQVVSQMEPYWQSLRPQAVSKPIPSSASVVRPSIAPIAISPRTMRAALPSMRTAPVISETQVAKQQAAPRSVSMQMPPISATDMARCNTASSAFSAGSSRTPGLLTRRLSNDSMSSGYDSIATPEERRESHVGSSKTSSAETVTEANVGLGHYDVEMSSPRKVVDHKSTPNRMNKFINFSRFRPSRPSISALTNPE